MIDFTWKVFSQTGNIETYLLLKEMETEPTGKGQKRQHEKELTHLDTNM
ncbi:YqzL family protein [Lentibacillus sp. N15]